MAAFNCDECGHANMNAEPINDAYYVKPYGCSGGGYWIGDPVFKCSHCGELN